MSSKESQKMSPKESQKMSPKESASVQVLPPKNRKEKTSVAHTSLPKQPAHPPPFKEVPSSKEAPLTLLQRSPPKTETKEDRKHKVKEESSSESSQEAELDASLASNRGNKKNGQATLAASPAEADQVDEKKDGSCSDCEPSQLRSPAEDSPAESVDILEGFLEDSMDDSPPQNSEMDPISLTELLKKTGDIQVLLYGWQSAKDYPKLSPIEVSEEEMDRHIERVLKDSHRWKDTEEVNKALQAIDLEDEIVRGNDKYLRMVYLRLGQALHLHAGIALEHRASMREAAHTWQLRAIRLIEQATNSVQEDNRKNLAEIRNESQKVNKELTRQLDELNKKYSDLQTEHSFACAALKMKEDSKGVQESDESGGKITQLTLELGEQRKSNQELRSQLNELVSNFASYRAGKNPIESVSRKECEGDSTKNNAGSDRISTSPNWGKTKKHNTPHSEGWDSRGESSTSQSDHGWGYPPPRRKDRRRTPPRDDRRVARQRSPPVSKHSDRDANIKKRAASPSKEAMPAPVSKHSDRDANIKKRAASPSKEAMPAKRSLARDAWISGGKEAILQWTGVEPFRRTIRSYELSDTRNMITRVKEAESDIRDVFYRFNVPYNQRANEAHLKYLSLQKDLGIPGTSDKANRTASLNFYYAKVLQMCYEHQNRIRMKQATDEAIMDVYDEVVEHNKKEPNPYEQYEDDYILPSSISALGEHTREKLDHKRATFRLWLQKNDTIEYHKMRSDFFNKVFLKRDMQNMAPMASFMTEYDVMEINEDLRNEKQLLGKEVTKPNKLFKEIYARVYTDHYREIIEQIETYATYGTPVQKFLNYNDIDTVCYIDTGASTQGEF